MHGVANDEQPIASIPSNKWLTFAEISLITLVFFAPSGWIVPADGEPHYLSKAKHFWDPQWCPNDFFCNTADAHLVFYYAFGWITLWLPLPAVALCGRVAYRALLALAWRRLSFALVPVPFVSVLSALQLVAFNVTCQLGQEGIFGGVEAKSFAYVFVVLAVDALVRSRWNQVWLLLGAATAFHVLVGGWSIVAASFAWFLSGKEGPALRTMLPYLCLGLLLALPGLLPALALTWNQSSSVVNEANQIYVFERLPHHLLPQSFRSFRYISHGTLFLFWGVLCLLGSRDLRYSALNSFVAGALLIAFAGHTISAIFENNPAIAAGLLRYYWFRLGDVLLPLGTALLSASFLVRAYRNRPLYGIAWAFSTTAVAGMLLAAATWRIVQTKSVREGGMDHVAEWREACAWAAGHTPKDAIFITPSKSQTFRWYADRSEVVNYKDIPQNAEQIVEWRKRVKEVDGSPSQGVDSPSELGVQRISEVGRKYGARYVITSHQPPLDLEMISPPNLWYVVYQLPATRSDCKTRP